MTRDGIVAVTGASGHVGANLVRALLERGRRVRVLVREDTRAVDGLPVERVQASLFNEGELRAAFAGADVVYHCAGRVEIARGEEELVRRTNVDGVRHVMQACLAAGVRRVVHFSSIHAFQQRPQGEPLDETRPKVNGAGRFYDGTKAAGEREVLAAVAQGLDAVIVNPTGVLGPHDHKPSPMGDLILRLARGRFPFIVDGGHDWVDARDVAEGAIAAEERGRTGERYLLSGAWAPVGELARLIRELTGCRPPLWASPLWLAAVGAPFLEGVSRLTHTRPLYTRDSIDVLREANRQISHAKAERELGYRPRPLQETIEATLRWQQERGALG